MRGCPGGFANRTFCNQDRTSGDRSRLDRGDRRERWVRDEPRCGNGRNFSADVVGEGDVGAAGIGGFCCSRGDHYCAGRAELPHVPGEQRVER